jgi:hypothetical protein
MVRTIDEYIEFNKSMTAGEKMDWVEYHFNKYRKMGYDVQHFRSYSSIKPKDGKYPQDVITEHKMSFHEYKCIDEMEVYLKNINNG